MLCLTVIVGAIMMGSLPVFVRNIDMNPLQLSFFRLFFGFVFLAFILLLMGEKPKLKNPRLVGAIVCVNTLTVVSYIAAIQLVEAATAALLLYMAPIYVIPLARLTGEKIHPSSWLALPAGVTGLWLMLSPHDFSGGVLFGLISGISYAIYFILMKKARKEMEASHITFAYLGLASLLLLPALFIEPVSVEGKLPWLFGLGLIPTALAFTLFNYGIKYCRVEQAPLFALVEPVAAGFFGYVLFGEVLTGTQLMGAAIILLSVGVAAKGLSDVET
ncbi:DMT family transporter [Archaeoglobus veneficus]|uniref:EamA domain-containing protein n=1 Tax=Archaeoglobus veneficus (strain DSM 11195 / SNP6) TaxID=693661 RepID=F2KMX3_ARCVS|nr:EamA family transporter [Archaeoglobus veneficus]AEA47249.1 protein of unknown function DUF6 transmembrane [Archaeoglobus veneficus SNP6]